MYKQRSKNSVLTFISVRVTCLAPNTGCLFIQTWGTTAILIYIYYSCSFAFAAPIFCRVHLWQSPINARNISVWIYNRQLKCWKCSNEYIRNRFSGSRCKGDPLLRAVNVVLISWICYLFLVAYVRLLVQNYYVFVSATEVFFFSFSTDEREREIN